MNQLQVFRNEEFGSIRTLLIGNEPYFAGKDVTDILGYSNSRDALARHVAEEDRDAVGIHDAIGREQLTVFINESGLYSLILSSKLPAAKRFKRWVTSEVLPAIRRHGVYAVDEVLNDPDVLLTALQALKAEREANRELHETVDAQQEKILLLEPKADYYDKVLSCPEAVPISIIAKDYGWSAIRMNRFLHSAGVQFRMGRTWLLYADYADKGYTKSETLLYTDQDSQTHHTIITKWTQKGRLLIYELMKGAGYEPLPDREEEHHGSEG